MKYDTINSCFGYSNQCDSSVKSVCDAINPISQCDCVLPFLHHGWNRYLSWASRETHDIVEKTRGRMLIEYLIWQYFDWGDYTNWGFSWSQSIERMHVLFLESNKLQFEAMAYLEVPPLLKCMVSWLQGGEILKPNVDSLNFHVSKRSVDSVLLFDINACWQYRYQRCISKRLTDC